MPPKKPSNAPRNPVAQSPLMRKGGVHEKSPAAKRKQVQDEIGTELEDWREAVEFELEVRKRSKHKD